MFGGFSEYTAFHEVGSVHVFLFFTKGTVRELQDSNSVISNNCNVLEKLSVFETLL